MDGCWTAENLRLDARAQRAELADEDEAYEEYLEEELLLEEEVVTQGASGSTTRTTGRGTTSSRRRPRNSRARSGKLARARAVWRGSYARSVFAPYGFAECSVLSALVVSVVRSSLVAAVAQFAATLTILNHPA